MKKKNLFVGIAQIVLSVGIFCGGGAIYYLKTHKADCSEARLVAQIKQAEAMHDICINLKTTLPQHEKALVNLNNALGPLKGSVDTIVGLRDYTVMKKKPFYALGNSFTGFQKSIQEVQDSLIAARFSFHKNSHIQNKELIPATEDCIKAFKTELISLEQEKAHATYELYCLLGIIALIGVGFLINGITICCRKENA